MTLKFSSVAGRACRPLPATATKAAVPAGAILPFCCGPDMSDPQRKSHKKIILPPARLLAGHAGPYRCNRHKKAAVPAGAILPFCCGPDIIRPATEKGKIAPAETPGPGMPAPAAATATKAAVPAGAIFTFLLRAGHVRPATENQNLCSSWAGHARPLPRNRHKKSCCPRRRDFTFLLRTRT